MTSTLLPYGRQEIADDDIAAVSAALQDPFITQGPRVAAFEEAVAGYLGIRHVVAVSSGTAALHTAAFALGIGPQDACIVPPTTFASTANCVLFQGARPRFVDIDPATWNLDVERAVAEIEPETRAVIAVSFAGLPVELGPLRSTGLPFIEDACHALGAVRNGIPVGGPGGADITCFSLHPLKAITTGEGGLAVTDDDHLASRMRAFRTHGIVREGLKPEPWEGTWYYEMQALGFNYRITDFQCALGMSQLSRLDEWVARRNQIASAYRALLADEERLQLPPAARPGDLHAYHLFVVGVLADRDARREIFEGLRAAGIGVQVHYIPVYRLPYYRDTLGYPQDECPHAEELYARCISLPMFPGMEEGDVKRVAAELKRLLDEHV